MSSATKVLLETIQVARHVGQLGLRPVVKGVNQAAHAGEELALWVLKLQPLEEVVGRARTKQLLDGYLQAKEVALESAASLSHQSYMSALQSGAQSTTACLRKAGVEARVIGPFDDHWNTLKVLRDIRAVAGDAAVAGGSSTGGLKMTPKLFVQFMREAERKKQRARQRDPVEDYVEWMLESGSLRSMGTMLLEKRLYIDVARIICFAFDQALISANGMDLWGHELRVKVARESTDDEAPQRQVSNVGVEQVEAMVDKMLESEYLRSNAVMDRIQRQLLVNCSLIVLQLLEDLTSSQHMQISLLGHSMHVHLEPLPLEQLLFDADGKLNNVEFQVNQRALDELVDAVIDDPEVQMLLVPDLLEAEVYRYVLHRMVCICQFILSQVRINLFGVDVRLALLAESDDAHQEGDIRDDSEPMRVETMNIEASQLRRLLDQIEFERIRVERELHTRRGEAEDELLPETEVEDGGVHEFQRLAALDRLARTLAIQRTVPVPIDLAFRMVSDFNEYPKWMPFCTSARVLMAEEGNQARQHCEVGFGLDTGTVLGTVGDTIKYRILLEAPKPSVSPRPRNGSADRTPAGRRIAGRVVADTIDGFAYGKRLVYDWRFIETQPGETEVKLNIFFQARSVFFLPLWDSMQATITSVMMKKFIERAEVLSEK